MTETKPETKPLPRIAITYCSMCNWLLRSAWMAQELLQTFGQDLGEVVLIPRTGIVGEALGCRRAAATLIAENLEPCWSGRDDREFRHGEHTVDDGEDDDDQNLG